MKIATIVVLVLAIVAGSLALVFNMDNQSPLPPDVGPTGPSTVTADAKEKLESISSHSLELGSVPLVSTIEDGVYRLNDYSKFYSVSSDGFSEIADVKTITLPVLVSNEICDIDIRYVETEGRVVGGGRYEKVIEQAGVYSVNISLRYTLTEMPAALTGEEGEKLLLVGFEADSYYSEAFAVSLDGGYATNLFSQNGRESDNYDGFVMLTDELVKNSGEYLYFFSSRLYERGTGTFNVYKNIDLFRTKDGEDELVAKHAHHNFVADLGDGNIRFLRSEYATVSYTVGSIPTTTFQEMNFEVVNVNLETMAESVLMESDDSYSSGFKRFGNRLIRMSQTDYGTLEVYDIEKNKTDVYDDMNMRVVSAFDVSDDGRYIAVGGYVSSVSTVNQNIYLIDMQTSQTVNINGKEIFLTLKGNFGFIDNGYFINSHYDSEETKIFMHITKVDKIMETFKESVED